MKDLSTLEYLYALRYWRASSESGSATSNPQQSVLVALGLFLHESMVRKGSPGYPSIRG